MKQPQTKIQLNQKLEKYSTLTTITWLVSMGSPIFNLFDPLFHIYPGIILAAIFFMFMSFIYAKRLGKKVTLIDTSDEWKSININFTSLLLIVNIIGTYIYLAKLLGW